MGVDVAEVEALTLGRDLGGIRDRLCARLWLAQRDPYDARVGGGELHLGAAMFEGNLLRQPGRDGAAIVATYHPSPLWKYTLRPLMGDPSRQYSRNCTPCRMDRSTLPWRSHEARSISVRLKLHGIFRAVRPSVRTTDTGAVPDIGFHAARAAWSVG